MSLVFSLTKCTLTCMSVCVCVVFNMIKSLYVFSDINADVWMCVSSLKQAKYHEDFERARGRGCMPGLDDPNMERYQRANQMMAEAGYSKGIHPQGMEMDRRPGGIIVGQWPQTLCVCVCVCERERESKRCFRRLLVFVVLPWSLFSLDFLHIWCFTIKAF